MYVCMCVRGSDDVAPGAYRGPGIRSERDDGFREDERQVNALRPSCL